MEGQWTSLMNTLKLLLEVPGFYEKIKHYINSLINGTDTISNFVQD